CADDTALSSSYTYDFTDGEDSDNWSSTASTDVEYTSSGAEFTITEQGDAPTLQSEWYIFFGRVEVHMKAASGTGIVSSVVLLSDTLDELDWEFLGGDADEVQTIYFGQGNTTTTDREIDIALDDAQSTSHNYTLYWTSETCVWYLDGTAVRTLNYADAVDGTQYPQTPMRVKLGIWAGGDSDNSEGTITWAGGETDYDDGPFTMTVESIEVTNFNPGASYTYTDQTGDMDSIEINDSDDSSTSSTKTSTKTSSTKTTSTSGTAVATYASSVSLSVTSAAADSSVLTLTIGSSDNSSDATATPTSTATSIAVVTSTGLGQVISPSTWMLVGAVAVAILGHL
ncbi:concanavalin A-like lectin/glucanase domain-containing protein, partial [Dactylonectria estremocensis]